MLNQHQIDITSVEPDLTVLEYLRDHKSLCGTKEGCASGDCGACTVAVVEPNKNGTDLAYRAVNSCVTFMSSLHGKQLITVDHLSTKESLHPVQQAMVDNHGSQCGFCTPGFIMSLFVFYHQQKAVDRHNIDIALSGNLCRCTGYRPIIDAAQQACKSKVQDQFDDCRDSTLNTLKELSNTQAGVPGLFIPQTTSQLVDLLKTYPEARMFAGSTDLALEVTQQNKQLSCLIDLKHIPQLKELYADSNKLVIGAALPLADIETELFSSFPQLKELFWRFASTPIRHQATLGGNVANASPIGDMPPALLALNAQITVSNGKDIRYISACDFFIDYRKTALKPDEFIQNIQIPLLKPSSLFRAYKVSKRIEDDISAVCAVFNVTVENGMITNILTGFGGVAATPVSAHQLSNQLVGKTWSDASTMEQGKEILNNLFSPIDDVRASASYRNDMIVNLWHRFWLETNAQNQAIQTRVVQHA